LIILSIKYDLIILNCEFPIIVILPNNDKCLVKPTFACSGVSIQLCETISFAIKR